MTTKRYPIAGAGTTAALQLEVLDFLLGQVRSIASINRVLARGVAYRPFLTFDLDRMPVAEFLARWHTHRGRLTDEAERRGILLPDPESYRPYPIGCWIRGSYEGD